MSKRIMKILIPVMFVFVIFLGNVKALEKVNERTNYKILIEDDANLLTSDEINDLADIMTPLTEYGNIAFKTIDSNSTTASSYASVYYHTNFGTKSGTLFLIDMDNRKIHIFSDGYNYKYITTAKANIITDNIYRYASRSEYYECAKKAFEQIGTVLSGGKIAEPMRYISNALISITIAFLVNFLIVLFSSNVKKASRKEILKNCDMSFDVSEFEAIKTGTHRVYSPPSSDSGGSSGGGGGGGSSGGGGGHSF